MLYDAPVNGSTAVAYACKRPASKSAHDVLLFSNSGVESEKSIRMTRSEISTVVLEVRFVVVVTGALPRISEKCATERTQPLFLTT